MDHQAPRSASMHHDRRRPPAAVAPILVALLLFSTTLALGGGPLPAAGAAPPRQASPVAPSVDEAALLLSEDQSGVFLNTFDCPAAVDRDLAQLLQTCAITTAVTVDVFGPNLQQTSQGGTSLERLPAGLYTIRQSIRTGYGDPVAFCGFGPTYEQLPPFAPVNVYDGYFEFELGPGQAIFCDWFNVPLPSPEDLATVRINKHFCPPRSQFDADAASIYDLAANCQQPPTPIAFAVERGGARITSGVAAGAPNTLVFNGLAPGSVAIVEELPDGFDPPLVFCSVGDELGNDRAPLAQATVDNDRIAWILNAGDVVFCDWFNLPSPRGVTISLVKTACPAAGPGGQGSYADYAAACGTPLAGVSFKLDGASTGNPGEQPTDANGQITWAELEADRYFLTEELPAGYGRPVVFCSFYDPAALQQRSYDGFIVGDDNRIVIDIADGESITCAWFNLLTAANPVSPTPAGAPTPASTARPPTPAASNQNPDPRPAATRPAGRSTISVVTAPRRPAAAATAPPRTAAATLILRPHRCETFYDHLAADAYPAADCTLRPADVGFELTAIASPPSQDPPRSATFDQSSGEAIFAGLPPDTYRLTEQGFRVGDVAFLTACQSDRRDLAAYPFAPFATAAADGTLRLTLLPGETLTCDWYDTRAEGVDRS